jgi:predicted metal-dependent hydrolase
MNPETTSVHSRSHSQASRRLTAQGLERLELNENDVLKVCVRNADKATLQQLIAASNKQEI